MARERLYNVNWTQKKEVLCSMIENQIECEDEEIQNYIDTLSDNDYETLLEYILDDIFDYETALDAFDDAVSQSLHERLKGQLGE